MRGGGCPTSIPGALMVFESGTTGQDTIYGARSGLKVNGVDLPDTPVDAVVAPVA